MTDEVYLGQKFTANHQLAVILTRHLGADKARQTATSEGWEGVLQAIEEQSSIVTAQR
ncbi:MAG: hypothetical protein KAI73_06960 [Rhodospirillaceae bacterium]|nr:hypothetical protein [Rhodospirillaceae bacterium]